MYCNTSHFVFSHGKQPRGTGDWAFALTADAPLDQIVWRSGMFSQAKAAAARHFRAQGHRRFVVLP